MYCDQLRLNAIPKKNEAPMITMTITDDDEML